MSSFPTSCPRWVQRIAAHCSACSYQQNLRRRNAVLAAVSSARPPRGRASLPLTPWNGITTVCSRSGTILRTTVQLQPSRTGKRETYPPHAFRELAAFSLSSMVAPQCNWWHSWGRPYADALGSQGRRPPWPAAPTANSHMS